MANYIVPKARNLTTGQTVKQQDLAGRRFQPHERQECQLIADSLAEQMTFRTGDQWQGYCQPYIV